MSSRDYETEDRFEKITNEAFDSGDIGPLVRLFLASQGKSRSTGLVVLYGLSDQGFKELIKMATDYGTSGALELRDALVELQAKKRKRP